VITYDDELRAHYERLREASGIRSGDQVLDIGCGAGQSTRDAARAAAPGQVLGIDVSAPMLERARELAAAEGLDNVTFEQGDAQTHAFAPERYDVAISRCGLMFFADAVAALRNIARAMRPGARLVALVWQARERNEWAMAIDDAIGAAELPASDDAFSLGDPGTTTAILEHAGFESIQFADVREPLFYGPDSATALEWVRGFQSTAAALDRLEPAARDRALERLRTTIADHQTDDRGVVFDGRTWIVSARRSAAAGAAAR
jgi:ubiquinone/menaquinone biosynthesis C-methylase UbiE